MYKIVDSFGNVYGVYSSIWVAIGNLYKWGACMMIVNSATGKVIAEV